MDLGKCVWGFEGASGEMHVPGVWRIIITMINVPMSMNTTETLFNIFSMFLSIVADH